MTPLGPTPTSPAEITRLKTARRAGDIARDICSSLRQEFDAVMEAGVEPADNDLRQSSWVVAPAPRDLANRRIEIMGGSSGEIVQAGLQSGADVYVADLSDAGGLEWDALVRVVGGLAELAMTSDHGAADASLMVRPRRLRAPAPEPWRSEGLSGGVLDATLYAALCSTATPGTDGIYLYLPNLSSRSEAALWELVLERIESACKLPPNSIITTPEVGSAHGLEQVEEILWEVRRRSVALSVGYVDVLLGVEGADTRRQGVGREALRAVVETCNRRGAQAICAVRDEIPLKPGAGGARVRLSRVVPQTKELVTRS